MTGLGSYAHHKEKLLSVEEVQERSHSLLPNIMWRWQLVAEGSPTSIPWYTRSLNNAFCLLDILLAKQRLSSLEDKQLGKHTMWQSTDPLILGKVKDHLVGASASDVEVGPDPGDGSGEAAL